MKTKKSDSEVDRLERASAPPDPQVVDLLRREAEIVRAIETASRSEELPEAQRSAAWMKLADLACRLTDVRLALDAHAVEPTSSRPTLRRGDES